MQAACMDGSLDAWLARVGIYGKGVAVLLTPNGTKSQALPRSANSGSV